MFTVTKLARRCGMSRTALLYYESIGLMPPPLRSGGNYRSYSEADMRRLLQIRAYREAGLKLEDIRTILNTKSGRDGRDAAGVLKQTPRLRPCALTSRRSSNFWSTRLWGRQR